MKPIYIQLTCEHAVNHIPDKYHPYFKDHENLLNTHRGIDFGAVTIAKSLSEKLSTDLVSATTSRLLIDCNRSLSNGCCFSEITSLLSPEDKANIIQTYYQPYRKAVEERIREHIEAGFQVWHLSIHSFTPLMDGVTRRADIGLLYDPKRSSEKELARRWQALLKPYALVRLNYPYKGISDGFTVYLRKLFNDASYVGLEIETNQAITQSPLELRKIIDALTTTLVTLSS